MTNCLFTKRLTRRDFLVAAATPRRNASGDAASAGRDPFCFHEHKEFSYLSDLARRVTIADAHDNLAAQLGDGKETDGTTNRPYYQTNPALFAAPHALAVDSVGDSCVVEWITEGSPRKFKHLPP
jgi:hypothetical protein